jgi:hypothetical protein
LYYARVKGFGDPVIGQQGCGNWSLDGDGATVAAYPATCFTTYTTNPTRTNRDEIVFRPGMAKEMETAVPGFFLSNFIRQAFKDLLRCNLVDEISSMRLHILYREMRI